MLLDPERFDADLAEVLARQAGDEGGASLSTAELELVKDLLVAIGPSTARGRVAVHVSRRLVADTEPGESEDPDILARHCRELDMLALRLGLEGQMDESVSIGRQALKLAERLVAVDADTHGELLASVQSQLSMTQVAADRSSGDAREATEQARKAVDQAAKSRNDVLLAGSLGVYARRLADTGDYVQALKAADRSVELFRELAERQPAIFRSELATALVIRALRLSDVGQHQEAVSVGREAIDMCERLVERNPDAYQHHLALSLYQWARIQSRVGPSADAVDAARRAADIYGRSAGRNRAFFAPMQADTLGVLVTALDVAGRWDEAVAAATEVVRIYEELTGPKGGAHELELARGSHRLAVMQGKAGRSADAVRTGHRAVRLYRRLVERDRDAHEAGLADSLNSLAVSLSGGEGQAASISPEQAAEAKPLLAEAAAIRRRLAAHKPDRHAYGFASTLAELGVTHTKLAEFDAAVTILTEAMGIAERMGHRELRAQVLVELSRAEKARPQG